MTKKKQICETLIPDDNIPFTDNHLQTNCKDDSKNVMFSNLNESSKQSLLSIEKRGADSDLKLGTFRNIISELKSDKKKTNPLRRSRNTSAV